MKRITFKDIRFWVLEPLGVLLLILAAGYLLFSSSEARAAPTPTVQQMKIHAAKVELAYDLPSGMLAAVCEHESNWRNVSGQAGEIGVCQIMPGTVRMVCNCGGDTMTVFYRGATGNAAGVGSISEMVDLPIGSAVIYSFAASIDPSATGLISNTATVTPPNGGTDPLPTRLHPRWPLPAPSSHRASCRRW